MKPGIKTTEFWTTIVGSIIMAGASSFGLDLDMTTTASIAGMVISYGAGRVLHKYPFLKKD